MEEYEEEREVYVRMNRPRTPWKDLEYTTRDRFTFHTCLKKNAHTYAYHRMSDASSYTVGVAICCYHGHLNALSALFRSIEAQTRLPDQVVVSCSSTSPEEVPYDTGSYSFPLCIVTCREKKNAAQNRNIAASHLRTDIVTFFDADDLMHPQRIHAIWYGFMTYDAYFMVHSFQYNDPVFVSYSSHSYILNQLTRCPYGSTIVMGHGHDMPIANGHSSIMRWILREITYPETVEYQGREDTVFSTQVIMRYHDHTLYCADALSCYLPSGTGGSST